MDDRQYHMKFGGGAGASVDAYVEYNRIVGDDDGGTMFTPEEYEAYKQKVIPQRIKNRLYTAYTNPSGMDCKLIGPETPCFCTHRYKQHKTDFEEIPTKRPILLPCKVSGCPCVSYHYVPLNGSQPIRCTCKHTADEHNVKAPYVCKRGGCIKCTGFTSHFTCACGSTHKDHRMIVETADEREARGHPVGQSVPYQAMGGLTGFSSLAEGYLRLDPSGRGVPSEEFLNQPITAMDNPFLRANVTSIKAHEIAKRGGKESQLDLSGPEDKMFDDIEERISATKKEGETDMDYFERRFQERLKLEAAAKKKPVPSPYTQSNLKTGTRKAIEPANKSRKTTKPQPGTSKQ